MRISLSDYILQHTMCVLWVWMYIKIDAYVHKKPHRMQAVNQQFTLRAQTFFFFEWTKRNSNTFSLHTRVSVCICVKSVIVLVLTIFEWHFAWGMSSGQSSWSYFGLSLNASIWAMLAVQPNWFRGFDYLSVLIFPAMLIREKWACDPICFRWASNRRDLANCECLVHTSRHCNCSSEAHCSIAMAATATAS